MIYDNNNIIILLFITAGWERSPSPPAAVGDEGAREGAPEPLITARLSAQPREGEVARPRPWPQHQHCHWHRPRADAERELAEPKTFHLGENLCCAPSRSFSYHGTGRFHLACNFMLLRWPRDDNIIGVRILSSPKEKRSLRNVDRNE